MLTICSICRDRIAAIHNVVVAPNCGHLFHKLCFEPWFKVNPTCPTCRAKQKLNPIKIFFTTDEGNSSECQESTLARLEEQCEDLTKKNTELEAQAICIKKEKESLEKKLSSIEDHLTYQTCKNTRLKEKLKNEEAEKNRLISENNKLEEAAREVQTLHRIKTLLDGTYKQVTDMLESMKSCDYNSVQSLCTLVIQLKQSNLKEKEKIADLRKMKKELVNQNNSLKQRIEDLESRLLACDENRCPKPTEEISKEQEVDFIVLDDSDADPLVKVFGVADKSRKVLDLRKFEQSSTLKPKFPKQYSRNLKNVPSSTFEYDGMGGSKRSWQTDDTANKPYRRNPIAKPVYKSKIKTQQALLDSYIDLD